MTAYQRVDQSRRPPYRCLTHGDFPTAMHDKRSFALRKGCFSGRNPEAGAAWNEQIATVAVTKAQRCARLGA